MYYILFLFVYISCYASQANNARAEELCQKGVELSKQNNFNESIVFLKEAMSLAPTNPNIPFQLAGILLGIGKIAESIELYQHILSMNIKPAPIMYNIGYALKAVGKVDMAIPIFQNLVDQDPDYEAAHLGLSFAYLSKGDLKTGWEKHEWNLQHQGKFAPHMRKIVAENTIAGKTILLIPEGGLGDTLHFIRYAKKMKDLGAAKVIVMVQKSLFSLLLYCPYIDQLIPIGVNRPTTEASATLMSMPAIFYDTEDTLPKEVPYLYANPYLIDKWKEQLAADKNFKIGICWQADVHNDSSRLLIARRGIPLDLIAQLHDIPGISWYSLQKKEGLEQLTTLSKDFNLKIFSDAFDETHGNFMDTAAVMMHMDLIISIDSAIAHLAGGLARPTFILLPYLADWRWIHNRIDSPWYPTMTIFKQKTPLDWSNVIEELRATLLHLTEKHHT